MRALRRLVAAAFLLTAATLLVSCMSATAPAPAPPAPAPEPEVYTNTIRWKTASEVDNFGFDVYRGDTEEGPWQKLNGDPIPGAGTTDIPQEYVWVDDTIDPTRTYYYYVESISLTGVREEFTPKLRAKPKRPADSASGTADAEGESE